jgi:chromosome segregation ATPase
MDYDELVHRLRKPWQSHNIGDLQISAADAIVALQTRVAELEADRNNIQFAMSEQIDAYKSDIAAARADLKTSIMAEYKATKELAAARAQAADSESRYQSLQADAEQLRYDLAAARAALRQIIRIADLDANYEDDSNPYESVARTALAGKDAPT